MAQANEDLIRHLVSVVNNAEECFKSSNYAVGRSSFYYVLEEVRRLFEPGHPKHDDRTGHSGSRFAERDKFSAIFDTPSSLDSGGAVMLVTDSLALPRESQQISDEDTWPYLLKKNLENTPVYVDSFRGRTIIGALETIKAISWPVKKLLIQVGIVDCAPRIVFPTDMAVIRAALGEVAFSTMQEISTKYRTHLAVEKYKQKYVPEGMFNLAAREIIKEASKKGIDEVYFIEIALSEKANEAIKSGPLFDSITTYNTLLDAAATNSKAQVIRTNTALWRIDLNARFANDGYHFGVGGHAVLAEEIISVFSKTAGL